MAFPFDGDAHHPASARCHVIPRNRTLVNLESLRREKFIRNLHDKILMLFRNFIIRNPNGMQLPLLIEMTKVGSQKRALSLYSSALSRS